MLQVLGRFILIPMVGGCRCDKAAPSAAEQPVEAPPAVEEFLVFPDDVRVEDASVNEFVEKVMQTCAAGEYEAFRLLWSAREDPLPREEFEQGWRAVEGIRIRALGKFRLAAESDHGERNGEADSDEAEREAYAIAALVEFDPTHRLGRLQEDREVIMMLIREHDQWRLARAPKAVRKWIRDGSIKQNGNDNRS